MAYTPGSGGEWLQCDYSDERCIKFDVIVPDFGEHGKPGEALRTNDVSSLSGDGKQVLFQPFC